MYNKEQASLVKESFWRALGQKMATQLSSDGEKIKWINYETGVRHLSFKMDADRHTAIIKIEITHPDPGIHELMYAQFVELKPLVDEYLKDDWVWIYKQKNAAGKEVSMIYNILENVNIFRPSDQQAIYNFFRKELIALDELWCNINPAFEIFKD
jgi:hypothetical protein